MSYIVPFGLDFKTESSLNIVLPDTKRAQEGFSLNKLKSGKQAVTVDLQVGIQVDKQMLKIIMFPYYSEGLDTNLKFTQFCLKYLVL